MLKGNIDEQLIDFPNLNQMPYHLVLTIYYQIIKVGCRCMCLRVTVWLQFHVAEWLFGCSSMCLSDCLAAVPCVYEWLFGCSSPECSLLCMKTLLNILSYNALYKDAFREVGLLEVMVTCLHRYAALLKAEQDGTGGLGPVFTRFFNKIAV